MAQVVVAGRYRLTSQIGSGGTGTVWKAEDMLLQRVVAVKELRMPPNISPEQYAETTARALAEGRVAARLQHPHIVAVHDVVEHDSRPWIIMQHIAGQSLEQVLAGGRTLPITRAAQIGVELLHAISAAHEAGVIHRDVKPSNVLIGEDGRVYLTDFSIAKVAGTGTVTNTGILVGSPGYIAPELIVTGRVAEPADLFGLGATLFRMVEGVGPFDRDDAIAGAFAAAVAAHPRPQQAGALTAVIDGLLAKDPRERLDAASAMAVLAPIASGQASFAAPATTESPAGAPAAAAHDAVTPAGAIADPTGTAIVGAGLAAASPESSSRPSAPFAADPSSSSSTAVPTDSSSAGHAASGPADSSSGPAGGFAASGPAGS
ncbi:serine/threonine-protein kinase, partial [Rhizocola hellebori]|uniref:serine/threonine-protein kinase n=1 Tax=Rhizocola hellebori TaxID=1392758 RepID=UPI0019407DA1